MFYLKVASVCLCLSAAAVIGEYYPRPKMPSYIDALLCIHQVRPSRDELFRIKNGKLPETKTENCLVTCLWKKANVLRNGQFLVNNAIELVRIQFKVDESRMENVRDRVNSCITKGKTIADECTSGGFVYKCILERDGLGTQKKDSNIEKTTFKLSDTNAVISVDRPH